MTSKTLKESTKKEKEKINILLVIKANGNKATFTLTKYALSNIVIKNILNSFSAIVCLKHL